MNFRDRIHLPASKGFGVLWSQTSEEIRGKISVVLENSALNRPLTNLIIAIKGLIRRSDDPTSPIIQKLP